MIRRLLGVLAVAMAGSSVAVACGNDAREQSMPDDDAGRAVDLEAIGDRALDRLSDEEAQAVCVEDARRTDPCREVGVSSSATPEACNEYVADCHAKSSDHDAAALCQGISFGPPGSCAVTVAEYLACLDAWNDAVTCDEASYVVPTPDACNGVVTSCARLASSFFQAGDARPCAADAGLDDPPDTNDDIVGADGCRPSPARLVILGDSVAAMGGTAPDYHQSLMTARLRELASPDLVFESFAMGGAVVADLPAQAKRAAPGAGHVFVWIWAIGNDMASGLVANPDADLAPLHASFDEVFDYFADRALFPDGATFLLNTQYWPFDECNAPGARPDPGPALLERFLALNQTFFLDVATARPDAIAIDHYPDFLGHADNANVRGCPHCGVDNTAWTFSSHPTQAGSAHIADKWFVAFDAMLGAQCAP
jgi:hypothetical protein